MLKQTIKASMKQLPTRCYCKYSEKMWKEKTMALKYEQVIMYRHIFMTMVFIIPVYLQKFN